MKTCPRCGVENRPEKAACWNCWAPLEGPAGRAPQPVGRGLSIRIPWTAVGVVALVAVAVAGVYFFLIMQTPAQVAEGYLSAVRNGNAAKRDRLATRDSAGQPLLPNVLMMSTFEITPGAVTVSNGHAEVPVTVNLVVDPMAMDINRPMLAVETMQHLRAPRTFSMVLTKEGFNWRVDQQQTRGRALASLANLPEAIKRQLWTFNVQIPGGEPPPPPAPAGSGA